MFTLFPLRAILPSEQLRALRPLLISGHFLCKNRSAGGANVTEQMAEPLILAKVVLHIFKVKIRVNNFIINQVPQNSQSEPLLFLYHTRAIMRPDR